MTFEEWEKDKEYITGHRAWVASRANMTVAETGQQLFDMLQEKERSAPEEKIFAALVKLLTVKPEMKEKPDLVYAFTCEGCGERIRGEHWCCGKSGKTEVSTEDKENILDAIDSGETPEGFTEQLGPDD